MNPVLLLILKIFGIVFLASLITSLLVMILIGFAHWNSWRHYLNRDLSHEDLGTVERGERTLVGANTLNRDDPAGLDNLCAFLTAVFQGLDPDDAFEKYGIAPKSLPGQLIDRNAEIIKLRQQGLTYKDIGIRVGSSADTAYNVWRRYQGRIR